MKKGPCPASKTRFDPILPIILEKSRGFSERGYGIIWPIQQGLQTMSRFLGAQREIIGWLLEKDNPSVRYFTLREILRRPEQNPEVREARAEIMTAGAVPKILAKQHPAGFWQDRRNFYLKTKYKGTVWQINILADLMAEGTDKRVQAACEFLLTHSQNGATGGFAYRSSAAGDGEKNAIIPCLTGNMAWSLIRLGYGDDPRTEKSLDWIARYHGSTTGRPRLPAAGLINRRRAGDATHVCWASSNPSRLCPKSRRPNGRRRSSRRSGKRPISSSSTGSS